MTIIDAQKFWISILRYAQVRMRELKLYTIPEDMLRSCTHSPEAESDWEWRERVHHATVFELGESDRQKEVATCLAEQEDLLTRRFLAATGYLPRKLDGAEEQLGITAWVLINDAGVEQPGFIQENGVEVWLADELGEECPSPEFPTSLRVQTLPYLGK